MTDRLHGFYYTPLFCEENIWHLAHSLIDQNVAADKLSIVFVSNPEQHVAIFHQKSEQNNQPVIWDYHVFLIRQDQQSALVYDFDSLCSFPVELDLYLTACFPPTRTIHPGYLAQFRLVPASLFLSQFYSDRSHMLGIIKKENFPDYPIIKPSADKDIIRLDQYINFKKLLFDDESILIQDQLIERFHGKNLVGKIIKNNPPHL